MTPEERNDSDPQNLPMLSPEILREVKGNKCFWCGVEMIFIPQDQRKKASKDDLRKMKTMDHLIAQSQGGGRFCVTSCFQCNTLKSNMHPLMFREKYRPHVDLALLERLVEHARKFECVSKKIKAKKRAEYYKGVYVPGYLSMAIQLTKPKRVQP